MFSIGLFLNGAGGEFLNYDDWWLVHNSEFQSRLTPGELEKTFFDFSKETRMDHGAEYLPVRDVSAAVQYQLFGDHPVFYHLLQIVLFSISVLLLYRIFLALGASMMVSFIATLLFASHPIHVESVSWLSGHKDLLSLGFVLAALMFYIRGHFVGTGLLFLLALGSKYTVFPLFFLLPVIDRCLHRPVSWKRLGAFFGLALACSLLFTSVGETVRYGHMVWGGSPWQVMRTALALFDEYTIHLLWPTHLQIFYQFQVPEVWSDLRVWRGLVQLLLLFGVGIYGWRRRPLLTLAVGFWLLGLLPTLRAAHIHQLADRYLLVSSIGFSLLLGLGLSQWPWRRTGYAITLGMVILFSAQTLQQNHVWADSQSLWTHAARGHQPVYWRVWQNLARLHQDQYEWPESARLYRYILETHKLPKAEAATVWSDLGYAELQAGRREEAEIALRQAILLDPKKVEPRMNLGVCLALGGRFPEALAQFQSAQELDPSDPKLHFNLVRAALESGRIEVAEKSFKRLEVLAPQDPRLKEIRKILARKP